MIGTTPSTTLAHLRHALLQASSNQEAVIEEKMDGLDFADADEGCEIGAIHSQTRQSLPRRKTFDKSEEIETAQTNHPWSPFEKT